MTSRNSRQQETQGTPAHRPRNSRSNLNASSTRIRASNNPSVSGRSTRQGKRFVLHGRSVFTCVDERTPNSFSESDVVLRGSRGEAIHQASRGQCARRHPSSSPQPLARQLSPNPDRTRNGVDAVQHGTGETSRQSLQAMYMRNLLTTRTRNTTRRSRSITSQPTGILDRINRPSSSSSDDGQSDPATYFTLVEMERNKTVVSTLSVQRINSSLHFQPSESEYTARQMTEFKETINKLDQVPGWFQRSDCFPSNPPVTPKIAESSSTIKTKLDTHKQQNGASTESISYMPQEHLDPQELMKKLMEISENRRTYYVQNTGSEDSLLETFYNSTQRHTIDSTLSLPMNVGRNVTTSTRALAGSVTTLKFIELSKRKPGSVFQNAHHPKDGEHLNVPRLKKCETFVPPVDLYTNDMIINVPIYPLSPVDPSETVDAPSVESVMMINQICDEVDAIFKDIHVGFHSSQEQIKAEEAKEEGKTRAQEKESNEQILLELRASFFPHLQSGMRNTDSGRSVQSIDSQQSGGSFLGERSLPSLPPEPLMSTDELIKVLNQKYEKNVDSGSCSRTHSTSGSEYDIKIIYSSNSANSNGQLSDEKINPSTPTDDSETSVVKLDNMNSMQVSSRRQSSTYKGGLRRFTAKVQIPTISDISLHGEAMGKNGSEDEAQGTIHPAKSQESQRTSTVSTSTTTSTIIREAERTAIEKLVHSQFGTMKLDKIYADPNDQIGTKSQTELSGVLAAYIDQPDLEALSCDIFVGDPTLMAETGTTQQLMLYQRKFPTECKERSSSHRIHNAAKKKESGSKKTILSKGASTKDHEKMDEQSDEECNDWVKFTPGSYEEEKGSEIDEEEAIEENKDHGLVVDPEELRLLFPFAFRLCQNSSWWKRSQFSSDYRNQITKEKAPEFDEMRDQLKTLLEEYEDYYTRFETVYRWGDPSDPPKWNKKYRSPFFRPNVVDNQDPNRFHLSDDALSMKGSKEGTDSHNKPPGYSTASYYVEPTKWWNLANVRRYVIRKELAKYSLEHHRTRLGLRARPSKFSASLILGCKKRRNRRKGQVCRRKKDANKALIETFMKKNLPRSVWKELKTKYEVATSLRYRQRHHWNPFHPSNKPSIDGAIRLGWYGQSLMRRSNITFLGQFAKGQDENLQAQVKEVKESEIRDKWQRDIMEIAFVAYCTNKLITEELQFLVMIGFWLGVVIDEFAYFMRFVVGELSKEHKKTLYEKRNPQKIKHCNHADWISGTEGKNSMIWGKILKVCDKTLFMLRRGLLPVAHNDKADEKGAVEDEKPSSEKHIDPDLWLPWYENTKLRRTNRRLLDSIALAYPDYYYLASRRNKYYHLEMDEDEARWFPIRYYDADKAEYNFISHDHPKWPDWKFLHMTSYGDSVGMSPITFTPYKANQDSDEGYSLSDRDLDGDNQIQDYKDSGNEKLVSAHRDSKVSEKKRALILMLMKECFDDEGKFRYILVNPIKFDRKRINMSIKTIGKTTIQMCTDPNTLGLDDITARFLQKSELRQKYIKLNPESFQRLLKKYAAQGESPRSFTDRRIDVALDYWYQKAAQVNYLLEAITFKISAVDRCFDFLEMHHQREQLLVFDDPNALKFQNEPVWNRRILENFQHGCSGPKTCEEKEEEDVLISRSSKSSSCSDSSETEEKETPVERIPMDFLKVMHTYFSLTTIETLKKENFIPFPVPGETLYCYERMKKGQGSQSKGTPFNKLSVRGRISERHRIRLERRHEMNKIRDQKDIGGHDGRGDGEHARCMGQDDDPRSHIGFKSKCPVCHKMLVSRHPSHTLFVEFKAKHIHGHRVNTQGIKPPHKTGTINFKDRSRSRAHNLHQHNENRGDGETDTHEDCYLHCKVPTILSIFQGRAVTKSKQEKLIRYFNRALHYEHAAVKDEITTRMNEERDELDFLKYKQEYLRDLHDEICERTVCPTISQQIQALLNDQEMVMKFKKRTILCSKFCKKRTGWPLKLLSNMTGKEIALMSRLSHKPYPYTLTTKKISTQRKTLSRRLLNDLYICWLNAYSSGTDLLSKLAPYAKSSKLYLPDKFGANFLNAIIKVLKHQELPRSTADTSKGSENIELSPFELWFEEFVASGLLPCHSSTLDVPETEAKEMSWISSRFNLQDPSEQSLIKRGDRVHEDTVSEYSHQEHNERQHDQSSEDGSLEDHSPLGKLVDVSPSQFTPDSDLD